MHPLKRIHYFLAGYVYVNTSHVKSQNATVLHISDTPLRFFSALKKLIQELEPTYIIHTGDLVDNIKLQLYPGSIHRYNRNLTQLIDILESSSAKDIYITLGNHDNPESVRGAVKRSKVIDSGETLKLEDVPIRISHYPKVIMEDPQDLNFFGHDVTMETSCQNGKYFFNGISDIYLVDLKTLETHAFPYPWGTDDDRLRKTRTSL